MNEIWREVVGYQGYYEVSNLGDVRSLDRIVYKEQNGKVVGTPVKGRMLKTGICNRGYSRLRLSKDGKSTTYRVHRLVAAAFIDNPDNKSEVNHIDGNKLNNAIWNLEYCTKMENVQHAWEIGLVNTCTIKISYDDLLFILGHYEFGSREYGTCALARKFGVNPTTIWGIVNGKRDVNHYVS
ncbi:NUMOD4 domain-containing protein [Paenibacillus sp. YIM B09110]|uniref:NUMOD4 domain-containing protein n=1 Tax=Paenibacillus sp. YIM B09110 TaxID=3126102 RepID=UPI00301D0D2C